MRLRSADPLFTAGSVRVADGHLAFVYKTSAEIGKLGDNTARLREQIASDELLRLALHADSATAVVLSHTRWASVGIISEANAHPLNHEELGRDGGHYVVAALNGDVDNYADLKALESLRFPAEITTDAKVIPALVSRRLANAADPVDAFRATVATFEGSVAIAAHIASDPDRILLAQRGSGQALYVGVTDDAYVIASEPYGVVEECDRYMRLDGETMLDARQPRDAGSGRRGRALPARESSAAPTTARCCRSPTPSSSVPRSRHATSTVATPRTTSSRRCTSRRRLSARRCAAASSSATVASTSRSPTRYSRRRCSTDCGRPDCVASS